MYILQLKVDFYNNHENHRDSHILEQKNIEGELGKLSFEITTSDGQAKYRLNTEGHLFLGTWSQKPNAKGKRQSLDRTQKTEKGSYFCVARSLNKKEINNDDVQKCLLGSLEKKENYHENLVFYFGQVEAGNDM